MLAADTVKVRSCPRWTPAMSVVVPTTMSNGGAELPTVADATLFAGSGSAVPVASITTMPACVPEAPIRTCAVNVAEGSPATRGPTCQAWLTGSKVPTDGVTETSSNPSVRTIAPSTLSGPAFRAVIVHVTMSPGWAAGATTCAVIRSADGGRISIDALSTLLRSFPSVGVDATRAAGYTTCPRACARTTTERVAVSPTASAPTVQFARAAS